MDQTNQTERTKYRIRFRKAGNLRLVSHHDLMHVFERMLRRAELPLCATQGFHPQPRMIFAQSLALGVAGLNEVLELELKTVFADEEVHARLVQQAPPGIDILSTRTIDFKAGAQVRRAFYRLDVSEHQPEAPARDSDRSRGSARPDQPEASARAHQASDALACASGWCGSVAERCAALLAEKEIWVERTRPRPRRFNLRPYISKLSCEHGVLDLAVWVTPNGTVRPDEVAHLLGLDSVLDVTFFERTFLELHDEAADDPETIPACLLEKPAANERSWPGASDTLAAEPQADESSYV